MKPVSGDLVEQGEVPPNSQNGNHLETAFSLLARSSNPTIRSTHSRCSGFISTDRKHVTVVRPPSARSFGQNFTGNSATAKCSPNRADASKIRRDFALISASESPFGTNTKISSSGSNATSNFPPFRSEEHTSELQ